MVNVRAVKNTLQLHESVVQNYIAIGISISAYNFGNFNYEIRVEGEGQDTFWVHAHNFPHVRPRSKNGAKHQNLNQKR